MVVLVNASGVLLEGCMKTILQVNVHVVLVVLKMFHHLLVMIITVSLVTLIVIIKMVNSTLMIPSGMVVLRSLVVIDRDTRGSRYI